MRKHTDFKSFYSIAGGGEGGRCVYPVRLDTYGCGCQHNCAYCYARSLLSFRNLWNAKKPSVASADYIRRKLDKIKPGSVVRLGGMTDCLMPLEKTYGATYQAIKMMNARGIGYLIVTKSDLIARPDYMAILDPQLAHIQITVTSTSDEPNFLNEKASAPSDRIKAAQRLQGEGFDVSLRASPYIPELLDVGKLNATGIRKCLVEFLRVNHWTEKWLGRDFADHTVKAGGYKHLPLGEKMRLLESFDFPEISVCEDVPEHYEYFKANVNHKESDCCNLRTPDEPEAKS